MEHFADQASERKIRVLVADNSRMNAQSLADAIRRDPKLEVIASVSDSSGLIAYTGNSKPNVALICSTLDQQRSRGFHVVPALRQLEPSLRVIMLLDSDTRGETVEAFQAGAKGILNRSATVEMLCSCIHAVYAGEIWASKVQIGYLADSLAATPTVRAIDSNGMNLLSTREGEVVRGVAEGLNNREIAERLHLSPHTIKNYLFRIFDKLGVCSRIELLLMTLHSGTSGQTHLDQSNLLGDDDAEPKTLTWCQKGAEHGLPTAQRALARVYAEGKLVPQDLVTAYMWYLVAERTTRELTTQICIDKKGIESLLSRSQIKIAERRAQGPPSVCDDEAETHQELSNLAELDENLVKMSLALVS